MQDLPDLLDPVRESGYSSAVTFVMILGLIVSVT
jgi:hypothetical protein